MPSNLCKSFCPGWIIFVESRTLLSDGSIRLTPTFCEIFSQASYFSHSQGLCFDCNCRNSYCGRNVCAKRSASSSTSKPVGGSLVNVRSGEPRPCTSVPDGNQFLPTQRLPQTERGNFRTQMLLASRQCSIGSQRHKVMVRFRPSTETGIQIARRTKFSTGPSSSHSLSLHQF
jgi:hypothetical protein